MKTIKIKFAYILIVFFTISSSFAQVGIGIASPDTSAMLDVSSADKGFLPPRMDETARNNIGLPGTGSFIGEFLILVGSYQLNSTITFFSATGMVLGGVYSLWLYNRIIFGNIQTNFLKTFYDCLFY